MRIANGDRANEVVESTYALGRPYSFKLGKGHVIQGLDLAVASMTRGEKSAFNIAPTLGYANIGCLPRIPPNAALDVVVELLTVEAVDVVLVLARQPDR